MFANINPLTHRKIEKAFAPIHGHTSYTIMHAHSALRPPHMLNAPPHVYAERISNARGDAEDGATAENGEQFLDPTFHQYVVTGEILESPPPVMTAEQAMEADAARALGELAVAGRLEAFANSGEEFPSPNSQLPPNFLPSPHTPFSSYGTVVTPISPTNETGEMDPADDGSNPALGGPNEIPQHSSYYRDPLGQGPGVVRRFVAYQPRKRITGVPVPVPHLTKPSRGRRVPTAAMGNANEDSTTTVDVTVKSPPMSRSGTASPYGTRNTRSNRGVVDPKVNTDDVQATLNAGSRSYICKVDGCGKAFRRGEHLKRHVRSLHTHEKPERCTYPGCGKEFSRKDNMQQHLKIHTNTRSGSRRESKKDSEENDDPDDDMSE